MTVPSFFERFKQRVTEDAGRVVLQSDAYPSGITYGRLDDMSDRVCRYLKDRGIGKEDFVMILMPREASAYISVIGVWKSGAATILLEEDYSVDRVSYIQSDLGCKYVITKDVFAEMMKAEPCKEYDMPSLHDACYATYTSGSTGKPKGILHEFGKLDRFDYDYGGELLPVDGEERFAIVTPLNFGPSIRNAVTAMLYGKCLYIVPRNTVKNPKLLFEYFNKNKITETSVTCSFFKAYSFATKYMKNVFVHSEPCTGIFENGINVINLYTLSEVVFPIYTFRIDRPYDNAPLGYANNNVDIRIITEDGNKAKPYEIGEIVVEDVYTRGYIHLPDKTAEAFSNGYFKSGDLGYYDENGKAYLSGRIDDMIKINGNRIEPMEIEANVKRVLKVKNASAVGFVDRDRSFIAVYLLKNELAENGMLDEDGKLIFSAVEMKGKLQDILPDYMIPSYYMVLDAYPKNENGKLFRKNLPKPMAVDYQGDYEEPKNDTEVYFCRLFERVLKLDRVGVNDDFYQIGGDSISSMTAVTECDRFDITIADIYGARTPRALSMTVSEKSRKGHLETRNRQALTESLPLLPEQRAVFISQLAYPEMNLNNLTRFFRLADGICVDRFKAAVDKVLRHHPVFSSVIIKENGGYRLAYRPELFAETEIVSVSPEELDWMMEKSFKPFKMENAFLYRRAIYICGDMLCFGLEIHHVITDGISLKKLFNEITACYDNPATVLPTDYFYLLLKENAEKQNGDESSPEKILTLYQVGNYLHAEDNVIHGDFYKPTFTASKYVRIMNVDKTKVIDSVLFKKYNGNVFFLTCFLKAMAEYNGRSKAFVCWTYEGRDQITAENAHGMLIKTMPMGIDFADIKGNEGAFETINRRVMEQIACDTAFVSGMTDDFMYCPYFIYQKDVLYTEHFNHVFAEKISSPSGCMAFEFHLIDNTADKEYKLVVKYSSGLYNEKTIEVFSDLFERIVNRIIDGKKEMN